MSIVTEVQAAGALIKSTLGAVMIAGTFVLGVGATETFEHTFDLRVLLFHLEGMGPRLAAADADKVRTVKAVQDRLDTCHVDVALIQTALSAQSTAIAAKGAADAKALATATAGLAGGQKATAGVNAFRASLQAPTGAVAATQPPGPPECLIPNPLAQKLNEIDRRAVAP